MRASRKAYGSNSFFQSYINLEGVKEGKRKRKVKRNIQEHEAVVRVQREKIQSGRKKDKKFEDKGGVRVLH